jgi:hypothetical protein
MKSFITKKIQLLLISFLAIANTQTCIAAVKTSPCQFMTEEDDQKALAYFIYKDIMGQPGELAGFKNIDLTAHESAWIIMMTTWAFHKKNQSISSFKKIWAANNCLKIYISCFESTRLFEIACRTIYAQLRPAVFSKVEHFLLKKNHTYSTDYFLFGLFLSRINRQYKNSIKRNMLKTITDPLLDCFFEDERIQNKVAAIMQTTEEKN